MNNNEANVLKEQYTTPRSNSENNFANDYTGTRIGKICSKTSKNYLLLFTILSMIFIYYFYVQWNVVVILSKSHTGLDYKFWKHQNLEDKQYLKGMIYFAVFHLFFFILLISFYKVAFTSPGYFSQEYINIFSLRNKLKGLNPENDYDSGEDLLDDSVFSTSDIEKIFDADFDDNKEIKIKREKWFKMMYNLIDHRSVLKRICRFCLIIKPERSHHCRVCRKCVLKYDHHCKFVSNCIGFVNYKYFFVFIFYTLTVLLFTVITLMDGFSIHINAFGWESSYCKIYAIGYFFISFIFISICDLFVFHLIILFKGVTTVENKDKSRREEETQRTCQSRVEESFGTGCFWWFCPTKPKLKFGGYLHGNSREVSESLSKSFTTNSNPEVNKNLLNSRNKKDEII